MPGSQNLYAKQGADFSATITFTNSDGTPFDLTNYIFASQIKLSRYTANVIANLVFDAIDSTNGVISLNLSAANSANLAAGKYFYDAIYTDTSNTTTRFLEGFLYLSAGVTNITPPNGGLPAL